MQKFLECDDPDSNSCAILQEEEHKQQILLFYGIKNEHPMGLVTLWKDRGSLRKNSPDELLTVKDISSKSKTEQNSYARNIPNNFLKGPLMIMDKINKVNGLVSETPDSVVHRKDPTLEVNGLSGQMVVKQCESPMKSKLTLIKEERPSDKIELANLENKPSNICDVNTCNNGEDLAWNNFAIQHNFNKPQISADQFFISNRRKDRLSKHTNHKQVIMALYVKDEPKLELFKSFNPLSPSKLWRSPEKKKLPSVAPDFEGFVKCRLGIKQKIAKLNHLVCFYKTVAKNYYKEEMVIKQSKKVAFQQEDYYTGVNTDRPIRKVKKKRHFDELYDSDSSTSDRYSSPRKKQRSYGGMYANNERVVATNDQCYGDPYASSCIYNLNFKCIPEITKQVPIVFKSPDSVKRTLYTEGNYKKISKKIKYENVSTVLDTVLAGNAKDSNLLTVAADNAKELNTLKDSSSQHSNINLKKGDDCSSKYDFQEELYIYALARSNCPTITPSTSKLK